MIYEHCFRETTDINTARSFYVYTSFKFLVGGIFENVWAKFGEPYLQIMLDDID